MRIFAPFLIAIIFLSSTRVDASQTNEKTILVYGQVPLFELTDQNGKVFSSESLKGNVWIADFIFTRCQSMCPLMSGKMMNLQEQLKESGVKLVSFSVDPEHDSPEVLSVYAKQFHADESKWFFLTGDKSKIWDLAQGHFLLGVEQASVEDLKQGAEPVMHSSRFTLIDKEGRIRGYYDSTESDRMKELIESAKSLSK